MPLEFKLPDIGEGVAEGEIVKWLVKAGDQVNEHQSIVEVMTDKATVEIPAPAAGRITEILAKEGDVVPVGSVLFKLETGNATAGEGGGKGAVPSKVPASPARSAEQPASASKAAPNLARPGSEPARAAQPTAQARTDGSQNGGRPDAKPQAAAPRTEAAPAARGGRLEFKLPDIGEGVAEGEIVKWIANVGDVVKEHQAVVEVMTDKATVELPAPAAGKLLEQRAKAGDVVKVGSVLFVLETANAGATAASAAPAAASAAPAIPAKAGELVGAATAATPSRSARATGSNDKVLAVPSARRVARELDIDLGEVAGSGRNGVVRRADVETFARSRTETTAAPARATGAALPARTTAAPLAFAPGERESRAPFRGVRRKIAEAMVRSANTAVHFTVVEEVDVTDLVALREKAKAIGAESDVKVTFMPFIMKATALALAKYPMLNGHLDEAAQEIVRYSYVNLGIAMDTEQGLIVPVVKEVQSKGILQLATELNELAERTRAGKVRPDDLKGSTFSITNAGNIGGILATPIINFPDIAILGVHRLMKRPGVVETPEGDSIEVRQYMNFSCSVDHRLADGADGARFLVYLKRLLESPGLLAL